MSAICSDESGRAGIILIITLFWSGEEVADQEQFCPHFDDLVSHYWSTFLQDT
jgi:hypothetical protein